MIRRIGIVANLEKSGVREAIRTTLEAAETCGLEVRVGANEAPRLDLEELAEGEVSLASRVDALVSFGGDGTFLRAARLAGDSGTPVLGINLGSLGFLAEVRVEEIAEAMSCLARGEYTVQQRGKLQVTVRRDEVEIFRATALNDCVLNMGEVPRAIDLEVRVEGIRLGRYLADGLIIATPTGSTAYSLSAGGPVVDTEVDGLLVTPICPHTLGVRPLILADRKPIEVRLAQCPGGNLTADGQVSSPVHTGDRLVFRRAQEDCGFVRLPGRSVFEAIQHKFNWGGSQRAVPASPDA